MRVGSPGYPHRKAVITLLEDYEWRPYFEGDKELPIPTYARGQEAWVEVSGYGSDEALPSAELQYQTWDSPGWRTVWSYPILGYRSFAHTYYLGHIPKAGRLILHSPVPDESDYTSINVRLLI